MVRLLKLLVVLLVLNALWRVGVAYWQFYQFKDAVQETAQFAMGKADADIRQRVLEQAAEARVPIDPNGVSIRRADQRTYIDTSYVRVIEVIPTVKRPWRFTVSVTGWSIPTDAAPAR